jgi:hypothetical protein
MPGRSKAGRFVLKSATERAVRSIRSTDWVWNEFGFLADSRRITRADLLELWVSSPPAKVSPGDTPERAIALEHLRHALTLKANAGGAIKGHIRQALELLE